jgi:hypothetical protein
MDNWNKVDDIDESIEAEEKANQGKHSKFIFYTSLVGLTCFLIATEVSSNHYSKKQTAIAESTTIESSIPLKESIVTESTDSKENESLQTETTGLTIDYSNADQFYNDLVSSGLNNECEFQTVNDVKEYINFLCCFDCNYTDIKIPEGINSREDFERITNSYYSACIKNNIKPELNLLFNNYNYMGNIISNVETKANNLKNAKSSDYIEANEYYSELASELTTTKGINSEKYANIPGIETIILISENYNHVGNAYQARKNEKTINLKDCSTTLNVVGEDDQWICPDATYKFINNSLKPNIDEQMDNKLNNLSIKR